jgi:hypothetical protein
MGRQQKSDSTFRGRLRGRTKRSVQTLGINNGCRVVGSTSSRQLQLILEGSTFPPGTNGPAPMPQTTLDTGQGTRENARTLEQGPPPQRPLTSHHPASPKRNQASPLAKQQQASPLDQQQGPAGQEEANRGQQDGDSQAQPGYYSQKQPRGHQPTAGTPQAQLPTAQQGAATNGRKTRQTKKKALKRYWARVFHQGE